MVWLGWLSIAAGVVMAYVGWLGWHGRLPRNRFAGVRTGATLRSDEAFRVGNRVAGPPTVVAGVVAVLTGLAVVVRAGGESAIPVVLLVGWGIALGLVTIGGVLGHLAARGTA
jgi:uncharacterized membrane protein